MGKITKIHSDVFSAQGTVPDCMSGSLNLSTLDEKDLTEVIEKCEQIRFKLRLEVYYQELSKEFPPEKIAEFRSLDADFMSDIDTYSKSVIASAENFFGFQTNHTNDASMPIVAEGRRRETGLPSDNIAGDPYEVSNLPSATKAYEQKILALYMRKFGITPPEDKQTASDQSGWGYISSGGSESNRWAIQNAFNKYPEAILYHCESAHFCVEKAVSTQTEILFPHVVVPQQGVYDDRINIEMLKEEIKNRWDSDAQPAIIVLTWGTTAFGGCDKVQEIADWLKKEAIKNYIHLDAAHYGGIPANQTNAPQIGSLQALGVDSISISLHKYPGEKSASSIVLAVQEPADEAKTITGRSNRPLSCSRTINPVSMPKYP